MGQHRWLGWSAGLALLVGGCDFSANFDNTPALEVKLLFGSALKEFCAQAVPQFNQQNPKLADGTRFQITCTTLGTGDVVTQVVNLAQQWQQGQIKADNPEFPTLISLDGDIYHSQLIYRLEQLFPGKNYIPAITTAPLMAYSPMVFMVPSQVADSLKNVNSVYQKILPAATFQAIDPQAPPLKIFFVQTAPTRSNSGLQTLVTQFAEVSGKPPEQMTIKEVQTYLPQVQKIQAKVTRYGVSTGSLARDMVKYGPFWASIGSVYESAVIEANQKATPGQTRYVAIYPKATFTSNMRAILPSAPWVSPQEREAAEQVMAFLRSPPTQELAAGLGLRPGVPGVSLGSQFTPSNGVQPQPTFDSLRPPAPEVVATMLQAWEQVAKKPSRVVVVVDDSGSMRGQKLAAVQQSLYSYINNLRPQDELALIRFSSQVDAPISIQGTAAGKQQGLAFVNNLRAQGATLLYDATLAAQTWLRQNLRPGAINAVVVLTDGEDSGSRIRLPQLEQTLRQSGLNTDERISFFTIGYGNEGEFNPQALQRIATINGGYYKQGKPETIANVMADLQLEF
ncbi:von Willebrand factor type A [Gloeomargarita lithophora Alchichica-D10]|uniref:von Willebrand factor type A n=1 Tax=Gloeomargarita lithophora Alchichica-D10 TaxID=1188229 RepID=A0A1J0ACQ7_9CYAN|nr:extracellular solute-binding protein [Gloeomargarita lithophora]APB33718.1 von Willebrand factor type A [Gloeomargarita lithophora Alchichica-D10]